MITPNEKEALLGYLEFHLVNLCNRVEKNIDNDAVGDLYNAAYDILNDMEQTIQHQIDLGGNVKRVDNTTKK